MIFLTLFGGMVGNGKAAVPTQSTNQLARMQETKKNSALAGLDVWTQPLTSGNRARLELVYRRLLVLSSLILRKRFDTYPSLIGYFK